MSDQKRDAEDTLVNLTNFVNEHAPGYFVEAHKKQGTPMLNGSARVFVCTQFLWTHGLTFSLVPVKKVSEDPNALVYDGTREEFIAELVRRFPFSLQEEQQEYQKYRDSIQKGIKYQHQYERLSAEGYKPPQ